MLTLQLFGAGSVVGSQGPVKGRAAQGRQLALLAVLALARGRGVTRDKLIALLWPESAVDRARRQLSDAVYIVRAALGDEVVRSAGDELALVESVIGSDVAQFDQLIDAGQLEGAVALAAGPLLDGFHISDAAEFERWLDGERARLSERFAGALASLAEQSEARRDSAAAVAWWRRLAAHDPYSGRVALRLMRALEAAGDRAGALQHARAHAALLRADFDAEPEPDVAAFAERLRLQPPRVESEVTSPVASAPPSAVTSVPPSAVTSAVPPRRRRRYTIAIAALVVAVLAIVGLRNIRAGGAASVSGARSVGVLPFVNMSADPDNAYFSDGLSEQIIAELSRIDGLRVAARTSSFALRDGDLDVRAIGDTLDVAAVLEGSVRKEGTRLRVTAQLIDAASGYHIWSEEYDRQLSDVFTVQEDIARAIAGALELRLAGSNAASQPRPRPSLEAYDLYLRGLYLRNSMSPDKLRQASQYFDRAIELEPRFALAYAGKASIIGPQIYYSYVGLQEGVAELRTQIERALELDPLLGEAHASLGMLRLFFEWDWEGAEQALRRAIQLNPSDAHAHHHLANYLRAMGRWDESLAERERAIALDPLNPRSLIVLARELARSVSPDSGIAVYRRAQRIEPMHPILLGTGPALPSGPAEVLLWAGRYDEAVEEYIRIATLRGSPASETAALRDAYAKAGMRGFWRRWLEMEMRQAVRPDPLRLASLAALIGDTTRALDWLDLAYQERNPGLIFMRHEPAFEKLVTQPRVQRILRAMKLVP